MSVPVSDRVWTATAHHPGQQRHTIPIISPVLPHNFLLQCIQLYRLETILTQLFSVGVIFIYIYFCIPLASLHFLKVP